MNDRGDPAAKEDVSAPACARLRAAALALVLLGACAKAPQMPASERPPAPVEVATAVAREVPVYLDEIGRAAAMETVWVRAQVGGRVEEAHVVDGAELGKGDLLFRLDARPFRARLESAEASLLAAQAALARAGTATLRPQAALERARAAAELARTEFARAGALLQTKALSRSEYDAKRSALAIAEAEVNQAEADLRHAQPDEKQAQADVKKAEADVATARLDVEYCEIRAPITGRAGRRLVDAGNLVEGMGTPLVMLERLDPVHVDFTVPEKDLAAVQRNRARGTLKALVWLPDAPSAQVAGELTFVDNAVEERTGTLTLRATFPNADHRFWPGAFVRVRLVLETLSGAVLVPVTAPQLSARGTFVYVVKDDGSADMRPVALGQRQDDLVVVTSGVAAGERVVVAGQLAVTPGGKVRVEERPAAADAKAPR